MCVSIHRVDLTSTKFNAHGNVIQVFDIFVQSKVQIVVCFSPIRSNVRVIFHYYELVDSISLFYFALRVAYCSQQLPHLN